MRLIGLRCVTLLLAALATLAYEQREIYLPDIAALASSDRVIEHDQRWDRSENHTPLQGTIVSVPYSSPESWIGLSGFESYGRAEFPLPSTADVGAGEVVLNLTSDLEHGAVARLRLNVNGTRRSEIVLQGGVKRHQVLFPLRDEDLLADRVVVTMAIEGAAPRIVCQRHWDSGVVVRLHPTSHLSLSVDAPLVAPLDLMRASGLPAQVIWPTDAATSKGRFAEPGGGIRLVPLCPKPIVRRGPDNSRIRRQAAGRRIRSAAIQDRQLARGFGSIGRQHPVTALAAGKQLADQF